MLWLIGDFNLLHWLDESNEAKKLAEQGDAMAQYNLGVYYANNTETLKNHKEAFKWFKLSAEHDYAEAQYNLGIYYANGIGTLKDMSKAKEWIKKSYDNGYEPAKKVWKELELWKY